MPRAAVLVLALAVGLSACMTQRVTATPSAAVRDARAAAAAEKAHPPAKCADAPAIMAQVAAPFPYGEAAISEVGKDALDEAAAWLACRPEAAVVVTGQADPSGAAALQKDLPQRRVQAVRDYLVARGVAADRLLAAKPAGGVTLLVEARGRGW